VEEENDGGQTDTHRKTQGKECKREGARRTSKGSMDRYSSSIPTSSTVRRHWMHSRIICFAWDALYPRAFRKRLCATLTGAGRWQANVKKNLGDEVWGWDERECMVITWYAALREIRLVL